MAGSLRLLDHRQDKRFFSGAGCELAHGPEADAAATVSPPRRPPAKVRQVRNDFVQESATDRGDAMNAPSVPSGQPPESQSVVGPLTRAAIFLVATINPGSANAAAVRSFCGDLPGLLRAVGFRDIEGNLSCVMGIGSEAWDRLFGPPRPAELHPFREIRAGSRHAVATPGDLMFHIRAKRMDLCFELATQIMTRIKDAVSPVD